MYAAGAAASAAGREGQAASEVARAELQEQTASRVTEAAGRASSEQGATPGQPRSLGIYQQCTSGFHRCRRAHCR